MRMVAELLAQRGALQRTLRIDVRQQIALSHFLLHGKRCGTRQRVALYA
jgi:hypothetical protein